MSATESSGYHALVDAVRRGEISIDYAIGLAAPPAFSDDLDLETVVALGNDARARATTGEWRDVLQCWRILLEAVGPTADGRVCFARYQVAVADWVYVVTEAVKDCPNGTLFQFALGQGIQALKLAEDEDNDFWQGIQLSRLGALHFIPYTRRLAGADAEAAVRWWRQHGRDTLGDAFVDMPEPLDALREACRYFRKMIEFPGSDHRGFGLKCLAQALDARRRLEDRDVDLAEVRALAREALTLLPKEHDWRLELTSLLQSLGQPSAKAAQFPEVGGNSKRGAIEDQLMTLRLASRDSPSEAVQLAEHIWGEAAVNEDRRTEIANLYSTALFGLLKPMRLFPSGLNAKFKSNARRFADGDAALARFLQQSKASAADRYRALLGLAAASTKYDAEARGLDLISEALAVRPVITPAATEIAITLAAFLAVGDGVNLWSAKQYLPAASRYFSAAKLCAQARLTNRARDVMLRGMEALERGQLPFDYDAIIALATIAPEIEAADPAGNTTRHLGALWNRYLEASQARQAEPGFIFLLLQASKGAQFGVALNEARRWSVDEDPRATGLLVERSRLLPQTKTTPVTPEDTEFFLVGVDAPPQQAGATVAERVLNLEREFDALMQTRTTKAVAASIDYLVGLEEAFDLLDDRTALLVLHSGRTEANHQTERLFLATRSRKVMYGQQDLGPVLHVPFGLLFNNVAVDDSGVFVASVRAAIQAEEGLVDAASATEGARLLCLMRKMLLGGLEQTLAELKLTGIDHLAVCAHGSTHFLPWHLLLDDKSVLADDFIVTYLPSISLLRPRPDPQNRPRESVEAFGLTFEGQDAFYLPSVRAELDSVARESAAHVHLDAEATEAALVQAFLHARRIHVATHGRQCATAPAFHRIYLTPDASSDGVLHAYELFSHDLRGLDLVTLSACETALGRVDRSDNLRGFPAALLQAGAATIVATLWEVEDNAAALFFGTFYARLARGDDKVTSFAEAQRKTRETFPQFRDWGAFHFLGQW